MSKITLFGQIIQKLDRSIFKKLVKEHKNDKHQKGFDSWSHLTSMLFCHFAKSQSLRDISNGLRSATGNLNHLGNVHPPTKSNLSYQNKHRSWELFRDYYYFLDKTKKIDSLMDNRTKVIVFLNKCDFMFICNKTYQNACSYCIKVPIYYGGINEITG